MDFEKEKEGAQKLLNLFTKNSFGGDKYTADVILSMTQQIQSLQCFMFTFYCSVRKEETIQSIYKDFTDESTEALKNIINNPLIIESFFEIKQHRDPKQKKLILDYFAELKEAGLGN